MPARATREAILNQIDTLAMRSSRPLVVGIAGPPGVGKTHTASSVKAALGQRGVEAELLPMDGFHLSNAQLQELGLRNQKGAPETFDVPGFVALLQRVRSEQAPRPIYAPDYDRALHEPVAARRRVDVQTRVVIVEGNYLLHDAGEWGQVRTLLDLTWYLEVADSVREARLIERQVAAGRTEPEAREWVSRVDGANAALIARGRGLADYVTAESDL